MLYLEDYLESEYEVKHAQFVTAQVFRKRRQIQIYSHLQWSSICRRNCAIVSRKCVKWICPCRVSFDLVLLLSGFCRYIADNMDSLEKRVKLLFAECRRANGDTAPSADSEFLAIRKDYYRTLEDADEKVHLASQMYDLVDRYLRRLDTELHKFKCELEADNKGITEVLEKRSLELDTPGANQPVSSSQQKENRCVLPRFCWSMSSSMRFTFIFFNSCLIYIYENYIKTSSNTKFLLFIFFLLCFNYYKQLIYLIDELIDELSIYFFFTCGCYIFI